MQWRNSIVIPILFASELQNKILYRLQNYPNVSLFSENPRNLVLCSSLDLNRRVYSVGVQIPNLRIDADYSIEGNILLLPLVGEGAARLNLRKDV